MPVTAKQCNASEMATLRNTLELFDTYKSQEEEKDSDEESFHLPLLDCEDDGENTKTDSDTKKSSVNGITSEENEDDILNKFDVSSSTTPDIIDPKLEETLLNDKDDPKVDENLKEILTTTDTGENPGNQTKDNKDSTRENGDMDQGNVMQSDEMDVDEVEENMEVDKKDVSYDEDNDMDLDGNCLPNGFVEIDSCGNDQSFEDTESKVNKDIEASTDVPMESDTNPSSVDNVSMAVVENSDSAVNETDDSGTINQTCSAENAETDSKIEEHDNKKPNEETSAVSKTKEAPDTIVEPETLCDEDTEMLELPEVVGENNIPEENSKTSVQVDEGQSEQPDAERTDIAPVDTENDDKLTLDNDKDCHQDSMPENVENPNVDAEENISLETVTDVNNESDKLEIDEKICHKKEDDANPDAESNENGKDNKTCQIIKEEEATSGDTCQPKVKSLEKECDTIKDEPEIVATVEPDTHVTNELGIEAVGAENKRAVASEDEKDINKISAENAVMAEACENENFETSACEPASHIDSSDVLTEESKPHEDHFPEPSKSPDLDSDDLLDVSMIRDQAEDDADLAAASVNDIQGDVDETSNEKTEENEEVLDKDGERENSEKGEDHDNELMESMLLDEEERRGETDSLHAEADKGQQESELEMELHDKPEDMDSEPVDRATSSDVGATASATTCETKDSEETEKTPNCSVEATEEDALKSDAIDNDIPPQEKEREASTLDSLLDKVNEKEVDKTVTTKRPASEVEDSESSTTKRVKLSVEKEKQQEDKYDLKALLSLSKFMKNKHLKKLTRADLEEFCVQKIGEVIVHKSEIGDINQQLRIQEQMVEQLRKDQQQLNKQVRDLEIVNKKLMQELRMNKKPLIPLRITRSVGLQVRLGNPSDAIKRNRPLMQPQQQQKPSSNASTVMSSPNRVQRVVPVQSNSVSPSTPRQIQPSPQKTPATTPILSSVLQSRRPQPATVKSNTPARRTETVKTGGGSGVIDLTDEDDKRNESKKAGGGGGGGNGNNESATTKKVLQQVAPGKPITAMLSPGVRLATPAQVKAGPLTGVVTSSAQLMYVLQPGTQLPSGMITTTAGGAQKTVLLNVQSNGFLTSPILNGSAVSVIPKVTNPVQSKVVNAIQTKSVLRPLHKHPAPLPVPPPARNNNPNLKPVPPKPHLSIRKTDTGIILQWRMPYDLDAYEIIASYQLYAYQETSSPPSTEMWRRVGDVKALALPMACTLTQFADKNKYYFAVRPVDVYKRIGVFSDPEEISL